LDQIYNHYHQHAPDTVDQRIDAIFKAVEELIFAEQWQIDEYDPNSRRIIVEKRFRVLYGKVKNGI